MASTHALPLAAVCFLTVALGPIVYAGSPDAGQILRDQSRSPDRPAPSRPVPAAEPAAPSPQSTTARITVHGFRFSGNEGLATEEELQSAVRPWLERSLSLQDLNAVAARITELLRRKGFLLARAYLPRQEVTAGTVEIAVVQAKVDGPVGIHRGTGTRLAERHLRALADANISSGQALQEQGLERALLLINDIPGVVGRVLLEQGSLPGTTGVSLDVAESSLLSGALWADNFGSRYTGSIRGNALLNFNDPSGRGDQLACQFSGAADMRQARATYGTPLGAGGLRANLSGSFLTYAIGKEFAALDMDGDALTLNGWLSYPLVLRRDCGVTITLGYEFKALADEMSSVTIRDRRLHSGSAGLGGYFRDGWGGSGYTAWSISATTGDASYSRVAADRSQDRAGPRADGGFCRFNLTLSRLQQLPARFSVAAAYFGQFATGNLSSSEKFGLGGPYGVRAYPIGEASGDEGHQLDLELRRDFALGTGTLQLVGFFDTGCIRLNKHRWAGDIATATGDNAYWLSGAGAGLNYSWRDRLSLRLSYAWRIGDNPGRDATGNNADGRHADGHLWATGQLRF